MQKRSCKQNRLRPMGCKAALLASTMIVPLTLPAFAESVKQSDAPNAPEVRNSQIELEADQLTYNPETGEIRALGNVLLVREGYNLKAGEVFYNENTGEAHAVGAVELTFPSGDRIIAPELTLENELKDAFVENIRLIMADGAQAVAASGERIDETGRTTLRRAAYSPCEVCADGSGKQPLWQLKAVRVIHDKGKRRLYYKDAFLEVLGIPIFWTPYFSHPDPTVDRASGLLPLEMQTSRNLGFVAGVPYYHVFSDSIDATFTPVYTSREGFVLKSEYRQHLGFGEFKLDGSITRADRRDINNNIIGGKEIRGHISAEGNFQHSDNWRSTVNINYASDDTYLGRYEISNTDTLVSEYLLEGFFGASYVSTRALAFQGLRLEDIAGQAAFALPLIDAEFIPKYKPLGGTLSLRANALALHRTDGLDTRRLSLVANWQKRWITTKGLVVDVDALARSDVYDLDAANQPDDLAFAGTFGGTSGSEWRNLTRLTGTVSWPLVKYSDTGSHTIEPIAEISVSPRRGTPDSIVNEDGRAFELSDLNLFSADRTTGFDLWEEGSRATFGFRWRYEGEKLSTDVLIGQSWRISGNDFVLADGVGLEGDFSDIVGRTNINFDGWIDLEHRYRLDDRTLDVRRNDIDVTFGDDIKSLRMGYTKLNRDLNFINREDREEIRLSGFYKVAENWRLTGTWTRRLEGANSIALIENSGPVEYSVGLEYENECIQLGLRLRETFTRDRDVEPGTTILFRLKLTNLG
ncbi:MAG: LPS-assembly protein LptD [Kordiimonadaceae bacterium]|nr:LPS-assembly protein LptD [Kordiimonadaceae bacterium]